MQGIVPNEVRHLFDMVERAGRFSLLPAIFDGGADGASFANYVAKCNVLLSTARQASLVGTRWFHDNPKWTPDHELMEQQLVAAFPKKAVPSTLSLPDFFWTRRGLTGIFRGGVLMEFDELPDALQALEAVSSGPHVVQGANEAFRSASARAKQFAASGEGRVAVLVRGDEIEVFASGQTMQVAFANAYQECKCL
jgi:hypothetical protein